MDKFNVELFSKKIRRLEILVIVLVVLVTVLTFLLFNISKNRFEVIQANEFKLINKDGQTMAGLELQDNFPHFYLLDKDGKQRLLINHNDSGTHLFLKDQMGTTRVGVAQFSHGGGGIALHGENSKGAAVLYFKEQGSLRFFDKSGEVTHQIKSTKDD